MKNFIVILFFLFLKTSIAQQNEVINLWIDSKSEEKCNIPKSQRGRYHSEINTVNKYEKYVSKSKIRFYICKELFVWTKKYKIDTCSVKNIKGINFSSILDLIEKVNNKNPLYPEKVFKKTYIFEKINDSVMVKYNVKWKYYIE